MKKNIRTFCSLILLLAFTIGILPTFTLPTAATTASSDFEFNDERGAIIKYIGSAADVIIPETINGVKVQSIEFGAFTHCTGVTSVTVPEGVKMISTEAFSFCPSLKEIQVAQNNSTYTSVDGILFSKDKTTFLRFPEGKRGSYKVPNGVMKINDNAFYNCTLLTDITIPDGVQEIGPWVFTRCESLKRIIISDSVRTIGCCAFLGCSSLESIKIPDGVQEIGWSAFEECVSLSEVILPDSLTEIAVHLFCNCISLKEIIIPGNVKLIRSFSFWGCTSLTSMTIPDSVTNLQSGAFADCSSLKEILIGEENPNYQSIDGVLFSKNKSTILCYPEGKEDAFYEIPDQVRKIGPQALARCRFLKEVKIPDQVEKIESKAFAECTSLTQITIPALVTTIGETAFEGCSSLKEILVSENNFDFTSDMGVLFTKDKRRLLCYPKGKPASVYQIPDGVSSIENFAFIGCSSLMALTIPGSVEAIDPNAFDDCDSLKTIYYGGSEKDWKRALNGRDPESLKNIEVIFEEPEAGFVFEELSGTITGYNGSPVSLIIPETINGVPVKGIGMMAFSDCTLLKSVIIPDSVTEIDRSAFQDCASLEELHVNENHPLYVSVQGVLFTKDEKTIYLYPEGRKESSYQIPDGVTEIGFSAFSRNRFLTSVSFPGSVKEIGASAFSGCTALKYLLLPDNVMTISLMAFSDCRSLEKVKMPNNITYLGRYIFSDCTSLKSVTIPNTVTEIQFGAFSGCKALETVYYGGTEEMWEQIKKETDFSSVKIVYNYAGANTGDLNGDGEVNSADGALLNRYLAKWNVQIDESGADINGDGEVNSADGALLNRHLAKWDIVYFD